MDKDQTEPLTPTAKVLPFDPSPAENITVNARPTPSGISRLPKPIFTPHHLRQAKTTEPPMETVLTTIAEDGENRDSSKRKSSSEFNEASVGEVCDSKRLKNAPPKAAAPKGAAPGRTGLARPPIRNQRGVPSAVAARKLPGNAPIADTKRNSGGCSTLPTSSSFSFRLPNASNLQATSKTNVQSRPPARGTLATSRSALNNKRSIPASEQKLLDAIESLKTQLGEKDNDLRCFREQKEQLSEKLSAQSESLEESQRALMNSRRDQRDNQLESEKQKEKFKNQLNAKQEELDDKERECKKLKNKVNNLNDDLDTLETTVERQKSQIRKLDSEIESLKLDCGNNAGENQRLRGDIKDRDRRLVECEAEIERLIKKGDWYELERRKLHNTIQELKGNIRVFCRMRPFLPKELKDGHEDSSHISFDDEDDCKILVNDSNTKTPPVTFKFDMVFNDKASQEKVFEELSQLVQSALDGYSICVFAYGQTGSGKTFTMEGPDDFDDESMGMIPRSVRQIFDTAEKMEVKGWSFIFQASMLEIYNEQVNDLLYNGKPDAAPKHEIKLVKEGSKEVHVTNLTVKSVHSPSDISQLMAKAHHNRKRAATQCNERSSRSHFICNIKIESHNQRTKETLLGSIDLVDLAGSERIKESGSTGMQAKEAFKINTSLKVLGDVIEAIKKNSKHIPFRESKLTYLLQNNFVGSSKTLMFVNISPRLDHANETVNSLRFAAKANNTNIGTASQKTK